ncbi:MAG: hypothetical protein D6780_00415, partial [Candidatus Dadabacteria bacterium]
ERFAASEFIAQVLEPMLQAAEFALQRDFGELSNISPEDFRTSPFIKIYKADDGTVRLPHTREELALALPIEVNGYDVVFSLPFEEQKIEELSAFFSPGPIFSSTTARDRTNGYTLIESLPAKDSDTKSNLLTVFIRDPETEQFRAEVWTTIAGAEELVSNFFEFIKAPLSSADLGQNHYSEISQMSVVFNLASNYLKQRIVTLLNEHNDAFKRGDKAVRQNILEELRPYWEDIKLHPAKGAFQRTIASAIHFPVLIPSPALRIIKNPYLASREEPVYEEATFALSLSYGSSGAIALNKVDEGL